MAALAACAPNSDEAAASAPDIRSAPWATIVESARGSEVNLFMWGGDQGYNDYVDAFAAPELSRRYDITLIRTPIANTESVVNKLLAEKRASRERGSVDLVWINGHGFATGAQAELWFGPWAERLPNAKYIDWQSPAINRDFGHPVEGREAPWSRAQFVLIYDSAHIDDPPASLPALLDWAHANPGRFTYPAPPDFTGTAFVEQAFILLTGESFQGPFDEALFEILAPKLWTYLNALEPHLWRGGETYPASAPKLNELYGQGEIFMTMSYNPHFAQHQIDDGLFPASTRSFVFEAGTLHNTSYLAIPFNAPNGPGAAVVANFLESPAAQIEKQKALGALTVLEPERLPQAEHAALSFAAGLATLPLDVLESHRIPEPGSEWIVPLQRGWHEHVARE
ncbi:MAG: ABC transporter substrate-binding protein [Gammaproteobacteria bacterium]|nr:ABC transporter substrate-binding protein [Gammaproteobacteria bacterium]